MVIARAALHGGVASGHRVFARYGFTMTRTGRPPKLTDDQVVEVRRRVAKGEAQKKLAEELGVRPQIISDIVLYKTRKVLG
jgi:hypothetical protein